MLTKIRRKSRLWGGCAGYALLAALPLLGWGRGAAAQEVLCVLSSDLEAYQEAFAGFQQGLGEPAPGVDLRGGAPQVDAAVRVVVAFGGKAALEKYPERVDLVYCLAPGVRLDGRQRRNRVVHVAMLPQISTLMVQLKQIQPSLQHLAAVWMSPSLETYLQAMGEEAGRQGMQMSAQPLNGEDALPEHLRALLARRVQAIWLPPDPLLVNAQNFSTLREFARANAIAFYAPTEGLVEKGAVASVAASYNDVGRMAATVVRRLLAGQDVEETVYPEFHRLTLNPPEALRIGLRIPEGVLLRADRIVP